jgi:ABC-type phosphate transport system substrate-binding protein
MKASAKQVAIGLGVLAVIGGGLAFSGLLAGYKQTKANIVRIDGSSTVYPITEAIANEYSQANDKDIQAKVEDFWGKTDLRKFLTRN